MKPLGNSCAVEAKQVGWVSAVLISTLFWLSACTVGPKYTKPPAPVPAAYKELAPNPTQQMKGWKTAQPQDQVIRGKWWETFNDPQLNRLEERVDVSNQNLKVAEAQFRQARALVRFYRAGYYPTITAGPSITGEQFSKNSPTLSSLAGRSYGDYVLPFDLSYEADVWGRIRRSVEAARASAQASAGDLETVKLSIHAELAVDYFELRGLDAEKQLLD